jgi:hypothetical protein
LISIGRQKESNSFEEAMGQLVWCKAMKEKLNALEKNLETHPIINWKKNSYGASEL